jgi:phage-related protein
MMKVGGMMTVGVTLPLIGAATAATNWASDLEESANAVNVVFGDAAGIIKEYSDQSAEMVGMSSSDFNQLSAVTGAFLKNVGFDLQGAAEETINLGERASDMASIFNTDVSQAMNAIQSGLKGEFNPLEQFGVKINAAAIEARALAMGLGDAEGKINDNAKAQAALALIYEQTNQFAGDFRNTSDGLANSSKILKAELQNQAAAIGQQLIPIALQLTTALSGLLDRFKMLTPEQQKTILIVLGIVAALGPLITVIGGVITGVSAMAGVFSVVAGAIGIAVGPLLLIIAAVIAVVALLALAWKNNWGDIQGKTKAATEWIKNAINNFVTTIQTWWAAHGEKVIAIATALWDAVKSVFNFAVDIIKGIFSAFKSAFEGDWYAFGEKLREVWDKVWDAIKTAVETAWPLIKAAAKKVVDSVISLFKDTDWGSVGKNIIMGIAEGLGKFANFLYKAALGIAKALFDTITGFFDNGSPSKLFEVEVGKNIMLGWAKGIKLGASLPADAMIDSAKLTLDAAAMTSSHAREVVNNNTYNITTQVAHGADAIPYSIQRAQGYAQL